jgi:hypothetical protein
VGGRKGSHWVEEKDRMKGNTVPMRPAALLLCFFCGLQPSFIAGFTEQLSTGRRAPIRFQKFSATVSGIFLLTQACTVLYDLSAQQSAQSRTSIGFWADFDGIFRSW